MNPNNKIFLSGLILAMLVGMTGAEEQILKASKDTFGRSNKQNHNSGANEYLLIANAPNIRTLIAFDLSGITKEITHAELRFRSHNTLPDKISMQVAPMVNTPHNVAWGEGGGALGAQGQNARLGEACYTYSSFRDIPWESEEGKPVAHLSDSNLWKSPVAVLDPLDWQEKGWISIPINDSTLLEDIRNSKMQTITFGLWGKKGKGLYLISSNNSPWPPELHLQLKEEE